MLSDTSINRTFRDLIFVVFVRSSELKDYWIEISHYVPFTEFIQREVRTFVGYLTDEELYSEELPDIFHFLRVSFLLKG